VTILVEKIFYRKKRALRYIHPCTLYRRTTTDHCKLTAVEVVATSSPLYKLTFFPTDRQTNLLQIHAITVIEELHENSIVLWLRHINH